MLGTVWTVSLPVLLESWLPLVKRLLSYVVLVIVLLLILSLALSRTLRKTKKLQYVVNEKKDIRASLWSSRKLHIGLLAEEIILPFFVGLKVTEKLVLTSFTIAIWSIWLIFQFLMASCSITSSALICLSSKMNLVFLKDLGLTLAFMEEVFENVEMVTSVAINASKIVVLLCFETILKLLKCYGEMDSADLLQTIMRNATDKLFEEKTLLALSEVYKIAHIESSPIVKGLRVEELLHCFSQMMKLQADNSLFASQCIAKNPIVLNTLPNRLRISKFVRFACAPYGQRALKFLGILPYGKHVSNEQAYSIITGSPTTQLVSCEWAGKIYHPGYIVTNDSDSKQIIVSVRGSYFPQDFLTDLMCKAVPFYFRDQQGFCHDGMLRAANNLRSQIESYLWGSAETEKYQQYELVITGHSLGAGIAAILTALLIDSELTLPFKNIHCFAYGIPSVFSPNLSNELEQYVTSIVMGNDMVPRFSLRSFQRLRDSVKSLWMSSLTSSEQDCENKNLFNGVKLEKLLATLEKLDLDHEPILIPCGRTIWIDDQTTVFGSSCRINCTIVDAPATLFEDIVLSPDMFSAHLPQNYFLLLAERSNISAVLKEGNISGSESRGKL